MLFARRTGQPLAPTVFDIHPRDWDTWIEAEAQEAQDARFAAMRQGR